MKNIKRSKAFIKIKQNIKQSIRPEQIDICRRMIELADTVLWDDELPLLKEFLKAQENLVNPISDYKEDSIESLYHQRTCGAH